MPGWSLQHGRATLPRRFAAQGEKRKLAWIVGLSLSPPPPLSSAAPHPEHRRKCQQASRIGHGRGAQAQLQPAAVIGGAAIQVVHLAEE